MAGRNITAQDTQNTEAILSALKVITQQTEVDGQRQATMTQKSQEAETSVYVEQNKNEAILAVQERFSKRGLSVDPCGSAAMISTALGKIEADGDTSVASSTDVAPGNADDINAVFKKRVQNTNPNNLLIQTFLTGSDADAAIFLSNAAGLPLPKQIKTSNKVDNELNFIKSRRAEALRSAALTSMEEVRNAYKEGGAIEGYDSFINQYGGGSGYDAWQKELATKNERGLMQEYAKLRAISLRLEQASTKGEARIAAVLGVLLAGETGIQ
ncbi:hypothetical protein OIV19_18370 [Brucella sp. HL-2]|nr:hypothetical protein [Brucella sp. HL-2]MCV9909569.1 hypothetical protein [Brucella sp. HL-2]